MRTLTAIVLVGIAVLVWIAVSRDTNRVEVDRLVPNRVHQGGVTEQIGASNNDSSSQQASTSRGTSGSLSEEDQRFDRVRPREAVPVPENAYDGLVRAPAPGEVPPPTYLMHERFASEKVDPNWGPNVEPHIAEYLKSEELAGLADIVSMECRQTVCEVRAVSQSVELNAQSARAFQVQFANMRKESWWTGYSFSVPMVALTAIPDGRVIMLAYLSKDATP